MILKFNRLMDIIQKKDIQIQEMNKNIEAIKNKYEINQKKSEELV